jgi:DNA mismatch endonuclease, patch repair protein
MASIRSKDTKPELALRRALRAAGIVGYRVHFAAPGGRIDVAFPRWRVAVFVDGLFWHGHPSKWRPGQFKGYWDAKIRRNLARDAAQQAALEEAGWVVLRLWETDVAHELSPSVARIAAALRAAGRPEDHPRSGVGRPARPGAM